MTVQFDFIEMAPESIWSKVNNKLLLVMTLQFPSIKVTR